VARVKALSTAHQNAGFVDLDAGRYRAAIEHFQEANRLIEGPLKEQPKDPALRTARLSNLLREGNARWDQYRRENGELDKALQVLRQAYQEGNALIEDDPDNDGALTGITGVCQMYGSILLELKRPTDALPLFERAIAIVTRQLKSTPNDSDSLFNLAIIRVWTSGCRRDLHDLKGALNESREAASSWDSLIKSRPGSYRYLHQKADNLNTMGNLLAMQGDIAGARARLTEGLEIAKSLPNENAKLQHVGDRERIAKISGKAPEAVKSRLSLPRTRILQNAYRSPN
jgi:tetratricopeptide (TPR) repeat protein